MAQGKDLDLFEEVPEDRESGSESRIAARGAGPVQDAMSRADRALREVFGFAEWRPFQREIVETLLGGRDVLAVLPTGGGK
ncbi:MAG: hypothetical protein M0001_15545, partial [Treponema sp.]|nr:hypothetical protein [Treponema sp.]